MEDSIEPSDNLADLKGQFEEFATESKESRALAERCRQYRDGKQITDKELRALKKRKQPPHTDNKIQDKCDALLGIEKQTRTDPKAFPRTPAHQEAAEVATDALRYVADTAQFPETVSEACDNLIVEGLCAGEVIVEKKKGRPPCIKMNHVRWDRVFYDVHSLKKDFSDKGYAGFFTWMDYDRAIERWKDKKEVLEACFKESNSTDATHDDKPRYAMTVRGRKRVRVFTHYYTAEGKWMRAVWCNGGFLEDSQPSEYRDEYDEPDCAIELQALYRDADGNPYGKVERYLDLQDAHNKRHSKLLHLLNTKQVIMDKGAAPPLEDGSDGVARLREQVHNPDGMMEVVPNMRFDVITHLDVAQSQFQALQYTDAQLAATGPNAAILGQTGSLSGRAKQLDQQAGTLPLGPVFEALRSWKLRMYRKAWLRIRQFWTTEMWIRVTDDEDKVKFVGLNQPVYHGDAHAEQLKDSPIDPAQKKQMIQAIAQDPQMRQQVIEGGKLKYKNSVAEMDVDIIIDESPDTVTVQQEQFEILSELARGRPEVPFQILIEASQLRSDKKKQLADMMGGANDPMKQQMLQMKQQMDEMQQALLAANIRKVTAEAAKSEAAATESQLDASIKAANFTDPQQQPATKTQVSVN